jgi:hypothetical protein
MNFRLTRPLPLPITRRSGPLAQLVEQLTFNQWVAGSNPARLTTVPKNVNENSTDIVLAIFAFSNVFQTRAVGGTFSRIEPTGACQVRFLVSCSPHGC